jgi:hypothetical protein
MTIESVDDCPRFQSDMNRLQEWCSERKFSLNAAKCKSIYFNRNKKPIGFDYRIGGHELEHVEEIKDLGVILDTTPKKINMLRSCFTSILKGLLKIFK